MDTLILDYLRAFLPEEIIYEINLYYLAQCQRDVARKIHEMIRSHVLYDLSYANEQMRYMPNAIISTPNYTRQVLDCLCGEPMFYRRYENISYCVHVTKKYCQYYSFKKGTAWETERMAKYLL
nr:hypothetical protein K-LCC10_0312 [Kaumoebavirus]